ncbi:ABC transporter permease [Candidatus Parcubacteria bacterium]|nr:ABC transporter permease [Candidatus Parcubacteria bacterium]
MMRIQDTVSLATRMFRTRPARTWLTILGIGVGIGAVVILVGLGYGLQGVLLEQIVFGEAMLSLNVISPPSHIITINKEEIDNFFAIENVEDVAPLASFVASITYGELTGSIMLNGVEPDYFKYAGVVAKAGDLFKDNETNSILLSSAVTKLFEKEADQIIGEKVSFKVFIPVSDTDELQEIPFDKEYVVGGVIEDEASIFAYIPLQEFSSRFVIPYYDKARVRVSGREFLNIVEDKILQRGFIVTALSKTVDQANKIFSGVQAVLALFGGIALVVSAIGMFNTMTVTLLERTKEIGIMRTIGGSPLKIKVMFLTESVLMGSLGGLMGILIGVGGGLSINFLLSLLATKMGGEPMSLFRFPIPFLLFIAVFGAVMGYLTGLFPSKRAGSLNPLDAIRG